MGAWSGHYWFEVPTAHLVTTGPTASSITASIGLHEANGLTKPVLQWAKPAPDLTNPAKRMGKLGDNLVGVFGQVCVDSAKSLGSQLPSPSVTSHFVTRSPLILPYLASASPCLDTVIGLLSFCHLLTQSSRLVYQSCLVSAIALSAMCSFVLVSSLCVMCFSHFFSIFLLGFGGLPGTRGTGVGWVQESGWLVQRSG